MTIDVATGIARVLRREGVNRVSTFLVCRVNNALGREAVAVADAFSRIADPYRPVKGWKSAPDPADIRAAVALLLQARNRLIYAEAGANYASARSRWVGRSSE